MPISRKKLKIESGFGGPGALLRKCKREVINCIGGNSVGWALGGCRKRKKSSEEELRCLQLRTKSSQVAGGG